MSKRLLIIILFTSILSLWGLEYKMGYKHVDPHEIDWIKEAQIDISRDRSDSVDYSYGMPPVGFQPLGSCVAWATGYYYKGYQEYVDNDGWDMSDSLHMFHPRFMYNLINGGKDGGAYVTDGFKCLNQFGIAPMTSGSYSTYDTVSWPTEKGFNDAIPYRCASSHFINVTNDAGIEALKQHMANDNDCAVIAIYVWTPFWTDDLGPGDIYDTGDMTGSIHGGHAICLVGYNDSLNVPPDGKGAFKLINSWGTYWGSAGYAWITYEALKNASICYGYAYYGTDREDYNPTTKIAYEISHNKRLDVEIQVSITPSWTSPLFFDWYQSKKAQYPYPGYPIVLDISDGDDYLSANSSNALILYARDTGNDGVTGTLDELYGFSTSWGISSPSREAPGAMDDYGYTTFNLDFPLNTHHWQSFQRFPDNTGFTDLTGNLDTIPSIKWTFQTGDSVLSSPIMVDIDSDDTLEVIVGSNDDSLYALNSDGSKLWSYYMNGDVEGAPAAADLDNDCLLEVVANSEANRIIALNGEDGSLHWNVALLNKGISSPVINSIDSDSKLEVVTNGLFLRVIDGEDGSSQWMHYCGIPSKSSPVTGNLYGGDGVIDIVIGQGDSVRFFNGKDGSVFGVFGAKDVINSAPTLADIDNDAFNEVIVGSDDDTLYAIEIDSVIWKYGTGGDIKSSPAISDIDADPALEVVFGSNDGYIYALNADDGSYMWSYHTGGEIISSPAITDADDDGNPDVIVASTNGNLYCIKNDGTLFWQYNLGTPLYSSPALGDIDGDNEIEIAIGGVDGKIYLIDDYLSGIDDEIQYSLYLSVINKPVTGLTSIKYILPERGRVKLSLFDITGRKMNDIVSEVQNKGEYKVSVDMNRYANGIYFYTLNYGGKSITEKMVLVK